MAARARLLAPLTLAAVSIGASLSLARVFDSGEFVLPVIGAAVLPHAVGAFCRRRRWPTALALGISLLALIAYIVWALEPSTTRYGFPLVDTWDTIGRHLRNGWETLRTTPAPAPVTDGAVLLAVVATWIVATSADWLAFTRQAVLGALAPALVLFVWSSTLGTSESWEISAGAFAVLAGCFLYEQNLALLDRRRSWLVTRGSARAPSIVPTAIVATVAVVVALVLAPAIPGAGADPILDFDTADGTRAGGQSYEASIAPLVDVGEKLNAIEVPDLFSVRSERGDYWRITALDEYSGTGGGQWTLQAEGSGKVEVGLSGDVPADAVRQVFDIRQLGERWLPAAYQPVSISLDDTLVVVSSSTLVTGETTVRGLHYTVESVLGPTDAQLSDAQKAATAGAVPRELRQYQALPPDFSVRITTLAQEVVNAAGATTPYTKAKALRDYFRGSDFVYDTDVDLGDSANAIEQFLEEKRGFCVQFASAYSVMARAIGLPTRLAVGYTSGTRDGTTYTVSSHDAHAWPEVWLAGLGWTHLFDPTPGRGTAPVGGSNLQGEVDVPTPASAVVPPATLPPPTTPPTGPAGTGTTTPSGGATAPSTPPTTAAPVPPSISTTAESDNSVWEVVALVALGMVLLFATYVAIVVVAKRRRRAARHAADPALAVQGAWDEALDRLREARLRSDPALTPIEFARVTPMRTTPETAHPMRALARTYTTTRYGDQPPVADDARAAWDSVEELERALTGSLNRRERWRRTLDPSTLRVPTHSRRG